MLYQELQNSFYYLCRDIYPNVPKKQVDELYTTLHKCYIKYKKDYIVFKNVVESTYVVYDTFVLQEDGDAIHIVPHPTIDILYGLYYVGDIIQPTNIRSMDVPNILLGMTQFLEHKYDYDITHLCNIFDYENSITEIQYLYMVITMLQTGYPYCSNIPFKLSQISDDVANHDLICCRDTDYNLDEILMDYGCFKNINGYYIYP